MHHASVTGKSLSEALIFASTNPQYDNRLFIVHENCKLRIPAEHVVYTNCCFCFVLTFRTILVHNMFCRCCELLKKIYLYTSCSSLTPPSLKGLSPTHWLIISASLNRHPNWSAQRFKISLASLESIGSNFVSQLLNLLIEPTTTPSRL